MASVVEQVVEMWRCDGVALNPPAAQSDFEDLRTLLGIEIPGDVRAFYSAANGMTHLTYDGHQVSFWSITKMREQRDLWGDARVGFADFLIDSWRFIFHVNSGNVVVLHEGEDMQEIGSFHRFLELYLCADPALRIL